MEGQGKRRLLEWPPEATEIAVSNAIPVEMCHVLARISKDDKRAQPAAEHRLGLSRGKVRAMRTSACTPSRARGCSRRDVY
jgi:hypothetical protein